MHTIYPPTNGSEILEDEESQSSEIESEIHQEEDPDPLQEIKRDENVQAKPVEIENDEDRQIMQEEILRDEEGQENINMQEEIEDEKEKDNINMQEVIEDEKQVELVIDEACPEEKGEENMNMQEEIEDDNQQEIVGGEIEMDFRKSFEKYKITPENLDILEREINSIFLGEEVSESEIDEEYFMSIL
jgi:hypothetical protein